MEPTMSRSGRSSPKKEVSFSMPVTVEDDQFVTEIEEIRPTPSDMHVMIQSALHVFQETTMDRRMEKMVETEAISLFEIINQEGANR